MESWVECCAMPSLAFFVPEFCKTKAKGQMADTLLLALMACQLKLSRSLHSSYHPPETDSLIFAA